LGLVGERFPPHSCLLVFIIQASAPKAPFSAHLGHLEDEAGYVGEVEEEVPHNVPGWSLRHLQARVKSVVAITMHHCVEPDVQ